MTTKEAEQEREIQTLRKAMWDISSAAVQLPDFEILQEGGEEAVAYNIIQAINKAVARLNR